MPGAAWIAFPCLSETPCSPYWAKWRVLYLAQNCMLFFLYFYFYYFFFRGEAEGGRREPAKSLREVNACVRRHVELNSAACRMQEMTSSPSCASIMAAGSIVLPEMLVDNGFPEMSCEVALLFMRCGR